MEAEFAAVEAGRIVQEADQMVSSYLLLVKQLEILSHFTEIPLIGQLLYANLAVILKSCGNFEVANLGRKNVAC